MGDDEDAWKKLPIEEKIQHKSWKARMDGYEQLKKVFEMADEKSPEWAKYQHYMKNLVVDANAFAQEKGLEVAAIFVENANVVAKTAQEVIPGVVAKGLGARPKAKEKSVEILLMYIEREKQEIVIEELCKSFSHKTPKNVIAAVATVREALAAYGNKVVGIKPLLKIMPALFLHKDKLVRDEAKQLSIEMFKWVNAAVKQALAAIPPVALKELEEEWAKLPLGAPPLPTRFLRSQTEYRAKIEAAAAAQAGGSSATDGSQPAAAVEVIDPYEFMEPVEILSKINEEFYTQLEDKKWSIRKDALTKLKDLASSPKLQPGDYGDIVRALKKIIAKDTNVMVVTVAAECAALLAAGLRKKFSSYSSFIFSAILERFKEKKQSVVEALREAADAVIKTNKLDTFVEDFLEHCESKSPNVKTETLSVFKRYILNTAKPAEVPKSLLKQLSPVFKKRMDESLSDIRDACYELIAAIWKLVGEKNIMPFISDVDKLKLEKIKETYEKLNAAKSETESNKPAEATKASTGPAQSTGSSATGTKTTAPPGSARPGGPPKTGPAAAKKKPGTAKDAPPKEVIERELDEGAIEAVKEAHFSEEMRNKMDSLNWKERQEAMEDVKKKLALIEPENLPSQAFVRIIGGKNNFKETNFNVLILKFNLLAEVAKIGKFSKTSFQICAQPIVDKISDIKAGREAKNALTEIAEKVGFPVVVDDVITLAMAQKNPKNQSESFLWIAENIRLFGFKGLNPKVLTEKIKTCLTASNPQVRQSAVTLAGVMYIYMGPAVRALFESEKPTTLQLIDAEFEKVKDEKPEAPTRGLRNAPGPAGDAASSASVETEQEPEDLMPRTDVSGKITEELLEKLADAKWKIREEGLQNVQAIIKEAAFITPSLGELPAALCKRLADSNKILVSNTAGICAELAQALGPKGCKQHFKTFVPALINTLSDAKPSVRQASVNCLDIWAQSCPLSLVFEDEIILTALKSNNVNLRMTLLTWLEKQMTESKQLPVADLIPCVIPLFSSLEDRNGDVRKAAQGACLLFLAHCGYDKVFRQTAKLSPTSQTTISKVLEGMRPNIPDVKGKAQPPPPVQSSSEPAPSVSSKSAAAKNATAAVKEDKDSDVDSDAGTSDGKKPTAASGAKTANAAKANRKSTARGRQSTAVGSKAKNQEEEDLTPVLVKGKGKESKEQRLKDENSHKILRWNFTASPTKEHVQQLNEQMATVCSKSIHGLLFHADFKFHLQAMQILTDFCQPQNVDVIQANTDLLFKWCSLRLFDTNTTVVFKVLDLIFAILNVCNDNSFTLHELEANALVPFIISHRLGDPKDEIRKKIHAVLEILPTMYPSICIFALLMEGTKHKNARARSESLEALTNIVRNSDIAVCSPSPAKAVKEIAAIIGDKDATVRNSALSFLTLVVSIVGPTQTKKWVGNLPDKQQSMLDERIKRTLKSGTGANNTTVEPVQEKLVGMSQIKGILQMKTGSAPSSTPRQPLAPSSLTQSVNVERTSSNEYLGNGLDDNLRPKTAAAQSDENSIRRNKYFHFDFEQHEKNRSALRPMPQISSMPEIKAMIEGPLPPFQIKSARNPYSKLSHLTDSSEVSEAIEKSLSTLTDLDLIKSGRTMRQLIELLNDHEMNAVFQPEHVQKLVASVTLQLKMCLTHHLPAVISNNSGGGGGENDEKMSEIKVVLSLIIDLLISLLKVPNLAMLIPFEETHTLLNELCSVSHDETFSRLPDWEIRVQAFNKLICQLIECANLTSVTCAALRILRQSLPERNDSIEAQQKGVPKKVNSCLKCCWKAMHLLDHVNVNYEILPILTECHLFLKEFPGSYWINSDWDRPYRTNRTMVYLITQSQGASVLDLVKQIPNIQESSEIEKYVKKVLSSLQASSKSNKESSKQGSDEIEVKGLAKTHEETMEDLIEQYKCNPRDTCYNFIRYKISNPNIDTTKFFSVVDPKTARWLKNILENPLYENKRDWLRHWPSNQPYPEQKYIEPSEQQQLLSKMKETIKAYNSEIKSHSNRTEPDVDNSAIKSGGVNGGVGNLYLSSSQHQNGINNRMTSEMMSSSANKKLSSSANVPTISSSTSVSQSSSNQSSAPTSTTSTDLGEFKKRLEILKRRTNVG